MDIKVFWKKDGGIVQLIDKEKIMEWPIELPLKFIEDIRSKLKSYRDVKVEEEISTYLDDILTTIAIPNVKEVLESGDQVTISSILTSFEELSETNAEAVKPIVSLLENLRNNENKEIVGKTQRILNNLGS
ncbi:MAG: hypothetical protein ACFE8B_07330 [Candidatus Hermodarchaeota archaeon]